MKFALTFLFALVTLGLIETAAQSTAHPCTIPKSFTGCFGGTTNAYPFARTHGFIQTWYRGDSLNTPRPILEMGWRAAANTAMTAQKLKLEIVLSSTTKNFWNLDKTFANNHGKDITTFFALKTLNLPALTGNHTPDQPAVWIKGDKPFVFLGPHFLVQIDLQETATPTSTSYRCDSMITGNKLLSVEKSCGNGVLSGTYSGTALNFTLTGAPPSKPVLFLVSTRNRSLGGMVPLPFDLSFLGMKNCVLGVDPILILSTNTDTTGRAQMGGTLPVVGDTAMLFAQVIHPSNATILGYATTNVVNATLGTAGLATYLYCWTTVGPMATSGPYNTNRGAIILVKP